ncbi:hypothetical protein [Paenibacillus medicaginis]|uniref:Uncharacterized protein n=1 Tax=Paenibacillus medicaginis TaxID=1470560 RepID=A0ABV5C713_9BACL
MPRIKDPFQGLVAVPSNLPEETLGSIMREGRRKLMEEQDSDAVREATRRIQEHINRVNRKGV